MKRAEGFTLIEVLVALAAGGMVVAAAATLITALGERVDTVREARARMDRHANAERLLRALWTNLTVPADSAEAMRGAVLGDSVSVGFHSWCETADGWLERCAVRLGVRRTGHGIALVAELHGTVPRTMHLFANATAIHLRYLTDARYGGAWAATWSTRVAPLGLAVIVDRDTLLLPVWTDA